jgi:hypothetical protein
LLITGPEWLATITSWLTATMFSFCAFAMTDENRIRVKTNRYFFIFDLLKGLSCFLLCEPLSLCALVAVFLPQWHEGTKKHK